jgi:hypothetical protein
MKKKTRLAASIAVAAVLALSASPASGVADKDCEDFKNRKAAQKFFKKHGGPKSDPHRLDSDGDGKACETTDYS